MSYTIEYIERLEQQLSDARNQLGIANDVANKWRDKAKVLQLLSSLKITEYELLVDEPSLRSVVLRCRPRHVNGGITDLWAIQRGSDCLCKVPNKRGYYTFDYEPLPSSRDGNYYIDYRFNDAIEAYDFWNTFRAKILATQDEYLDFVKKVNGKQ